MTTYLRGAIAVAGVAAVAWLVAGARLPWSRTQSDAPPSQASAQPSAAACPTDAPLAPLNFTVKDMHDQPVQLSDYAGKVVLLDFWATWCGPCKVEIPGFIDLQNKYGKDGFQVLGVSIDDTVAQLKPYAADMGMNYPVLQGLGHDDLLDAFGPMFGIPVSVVISRDGKMCARHMGFTSKDVFEAQIRALL
jgi:thiol-disulfide isomerase/thioredoxin